MVHLIFVISKIPKNKKKQKKLGPLFWDPYFGTPNMLGLLYNYMSLGRVSKSGRRCSWLGFGSRSAPVISGGVPNPYDLDFGYYLGVPFYHFMSNWETAGAVLNFTKRGGGQAIVGDRVEAWKNTYLTPGEGEALVAKDVNGENYFGINGYPTLVETDYGGKKLKGLKFTGTEYLQINGSTVTNVYNPPGPIFSTGGASWAGNTGATFVLVIDSSEHIQDTGSASVVQSLLYSRQPSTSSGEIVPMTWPTTEDYGIQFFRNWKSSPTNIHGTELAVGPQGVMQGITWATNGLVRSPIQGFGGAEMINIPNDQEGANLEYGAGLNFAARWANPGIQVILLEYDNVNQLKHQDAPGFGVDRAYEGPQVKIYGMSNPNTTGDWGTPWNGLDLTVPKITFTNPMLRNHNLFNDAHLFLGGVPGYRLQSPYNNPTGHGFRGIIYEVMMVEGVLSPSDKQRLQKILERKYPLSL